MVELGFMGLRGILGFGRTRINWIGEILGFWAFGLELEVYLLDIIGLLFGYNGQLDL